ncbi:hypothetical protein KIPB_011998, partial [Kipferlia bialata]
TLSECIRILGQDEDVPETHTPTPPAVGEGGDPAVALVETLKRLLDAPMTDSTVVETTLQEMLGLCRSDPERRMGVFRAGAVPVLSACLVSHPMSGEVAAACYGALSELACSGDLRIHLAALGCNRLALGVLTSHLDHEELAAPAANDTLLVALISETVDSDFHSVDTLNVLLAANSQCKLCKAAFDTGAHLKLMEGRNDHPRSWRWTSAMCRLIKYMCREGDGVKIDLCVAGAVVALLDSLAKMGEDVVVCSCGMEALSSLSKMGK